MAKLVQGQPVFKESNRTFHENQWFTWTDPKNKIYANLRLTEKVGIDGNIVDNPVTELPTEAAVNAKLKELQDAWDAANG